MLQPNFNTEDMNREQQRVEVRPTVIRKLLYNNSCCKTFSDARTVQKWLRRNRLRTKQLRKLLLRRWHP